MERTESVQEAADKLGVNTETLYRWIWQEKVPAEKFGGRWRVNSDEIRQAWREKP